VSQRGPEVLALLTDELATDALAGEDWEQVRDHLTESTAESLDPVDVLAEPLDEPGGQVDDPALTSLGTSLSPTQQWDDYTSQTVRKIEANSNGRRKGRAGFRSYVHAVMLDRQILA